jgi:hypothetical protein
MAGDCRCLFHCSIPGKTSENHENLTQESSWVPDPMRRVYVCRKLNTIEERRHVQNYLFPQGDMGKRPELTN